MLSCAMEQTSAGQSGVSEFDHGASSSVFVEAGDGLKPVGDGVVLLGSYNGSSCTFAAVVTQDDDVLHAEVLDGVGYGSICAGIVLMILVPNVRLGEHRADGRLENGRRR